MSISLYSIYAKSCIELARSVIIKSEATARAMNKKDRDDSDVVVTFQAEEPFFNEDDPNTWRYYMHMAGEYHRSDKAWETVTVLDDKGNPVINKITGKPMTRSELRPVIKVISLDTFELIEFTKENLSEHRATWREYQKGSTYYRDLVNKFPTKRLLIDGVLNPIDKQRAINARDHEILYYDKRYVEENEHSLIGKIQNYIDMYYSRWNNDDYEKVADLYVPTLIGILYLYLPYIIMTLRYEASRTIEAHSFHVWNYLGSHQWLDEYSAHMTLYQRMWFYRNIRWSEINAGKLSTFMKHIDVVMTHRNLPISEFHTHFDKTLMEEDPEVFYPEVDFERKPLNMADTMSKAERYRDIQTMVELEKPEARDNHQYLLHDIERLKKTLTRSPDKVLSSKVVESSVIDHDKRKAIKSHDVEINHWIYLTTLGLYTPKISIANPTNSEYFVFSQPEALVVFIYALMRSYELDPNWIPTLSVTKVLRYKKPKIEDVRKLMDGRITSPTYCYAAHEYAFEPYKIISTEKFAEFINKVVALKNIHRNLYSFCHDYRENVQIKTMTEQYYESIVCKLTPEPMKFHTYFRQRGWVMEGEQWTPERYGKLATDIIKYATGSDLMKRMGVKEIQGMMVRLLKQLSSYSIQFLRKVNEEDITVVDWPYLRYHKLGEKWRDHKLIDINTLDFYNLKNKLYHEHDHTLLGAPLHADNDYLRLRAKDNLNLILDLDNHSDVKTRSRFRMPSVGFRFLRSRPIPPKAPDANINPWDMTQFRIHNTTEDRSRVDVTDEGELIVRGVVYVKGTYKGIK